MDKTLTFKYYKSINYSQHNNNYNMQKNKNIQVFAFLILITLYSAYQKLKKELYISQKNAMLSKVDMLCDNSQLRKREL